MKKKGKSYFIVDDDTDDQQFLVEALVENDPSCQCFTASDGQEAITNLIEAITPVPDVIFLDLNMPVLNGRQFLTKFKQTRFFQRIPVIIYSTTSDNNEIRELIKQGAAHFLTKQHSFQTLRKQLSEIAIISGRGPEESTGRFWTLFSRSAGPGHA